MLLECCRVPLFLGKLQMLQETRCVCKCCRACRCCSPFNVVEFAVALKIVAGVAELSKCCERAGFFKMLQHEIITFFLTCLLR